MKIIVDTDIGNDCDDAGALAILHNLKNEKNIEILAILSSTSLIEGAYCTEAINNYYKHECLIGYNDKKGYFDHYKKKTYTQIVANKFHHNNSYLSYIKAFRKSLASANDNEVIFIALGPMHALKMALISNCDEYSKLNGIDLFNQKVKEVYVMAGKFCTEKIYFENTEVISEWNIKSDIKSFQYFMNNCHKEITFIPFELGMMLTGKNLKDINNPVKVSYDYAANGLRNSWDPITMYYALTNDNVSFKRSNKGIVKITDDGVSSFKENTNGKHYVLYSLLDDENIKEIIDNYLK